MKISIPLWADSENSSTGSVTLDFEIDLDMGRVTISFSDSDRKVTVVSRKLLIVLRILDH